MSDNQGSIDFQFGGDSKTAVSQLDKLRQVIEATLKSADSLQKSLNITFQGGAKPSARAFDKFQAQGPASASELGTVAIEKYIKDKFRQIDNTFSQALARISNRKFAAKQNELNTSSASMKVRESLAGLNRYLQALKAMQDNIDATMRAAQSSLRTRASRGTDYYANREILAARRAAEDAMRVQKGDAAVGWQKRWDSLNSNGGADLFKVQGLVRLNSMVQSAGLQGFQFVADQVVGLDKAFHNLQAVTDTSSAQMGDLKTKLTEAAQASKFTALEVSDAATTMAQAGLSAKEVGDAIKGVTTLAAASGSTLAQSVDVVTSVLGQFDLRTNETANIANVMTAALNESKLTMEKLALGLQYSGNIAAQAGVSYTELTSVLAGLSNAGIKSGSTLGTGIRQLLTEFMAPSEKLTKRLEALGLHLSDVDIKTHGFVGVLKNLANSGFTTADAMQTMDLRAANAFAGISNNMSTIEHAGQSLTLTTAAARANATQMESLSNIWARLTSNIGVVGYQTFEPALGGLKLLTKAAADAVGSLSNFGSALPIVGTLLTAGLAGGAAIAAQKAALLTTNLAGFTTLAGRIGALSLGSIFSGVGIAVIGVTAGLSLLNMLYESQEQRIEKVRGRLEGYKGAVDSSSASIQRINEVILGLANQQQTLDKDDAARKQKMLELEQAFKDLGLTLNDTSLKTEGMIKALEKLKEPFQSTLLNDLNGQLRETIKLMDEVKNRRMDDGGRDWRGRTSLQSAVDNYGGMFKQAPWQSLNFNAEDYVAKLFGSKDIGRAFALASAPTADGIDKVELGSLINKLSTEALKLQSDNRANPNSDTKARLKALETILENLYKRADTLREQDKLDIAYKDTLNQKALEQVQKGEYPKSPDNGAPALTYKDLEGSTRGSIASFNQRIDAITNDKGVSEEDKQAKLRELRFEVDSFISNIVNMLDVLLVDATKGMDKDVDQNALRAKLKSGLASMFDGIHSKVITQLDKTEGEVKKLNDHDQKVRLKEATKASTKATDSIGSSTTSTQLENAITNTKKAFDEEIKALTDAHNAEIEKLGKGAESAQSAENFKDTKENLNKKIGKAAVDTVNKYQELIQKDLDKNISSIEIETSLEQTSSSGVLEARQRLIQATQSAAQKQIEMIEKMKDQIDEAFGPGTAMSLIVKAQEDLLKKQREVLLKNFQDLVERNKTDLYKSNGVDRADARVSLFNSPLHSDNYTDAERAWATRQANMVKEKADIAYVNQLLAEQKGLKASFDHAQSINDTNGISLYGEQLKVVNDKLKEMPEHLRRAGEAEREIAQMSTIDRIKMLNNEFIRSLGMQEVDGQWQMTAKKFGEYWTEALTGVQSAMKDLFVSVFNGTKSAGEAFRSFAKSIVDKLLDIVSTILTNQILASLFGIESVGGKSGGYTATGGGLFGGLFKGVLGETTKAPAAAAAAAAAAAPAAGQSTLSAASQAVNSRIGNAFSMFGGINRTQFEAELANPQIRDKLFGMTYAEAGANPERQQAVMESFFNRASARGYSLEDVLNGKNIKSNNYFPKESFDNSTAYLSGKRLSDANLQAALDKVRNGSNISDYATGNASLDPKTGRFPGLDGQSYKDFGGERLFVEKYKPDTTWADSQRQMAQSMQPVQQASNQAAQSVQKLAESSSNATTSVTDLGKNLAETATKTGGGIGSDAVASNVNVPVEGAGATGGIGGMFTNMFSGIGSMISGLMQGLMGMLQGLMGGIGNIFSGLFSGFGLFYQGGMIRAAQGFNIPTRDSVPILAQPGEAVLNRSAVSMIGRDGIDYINGMGNRRYNESKKVGNDNRKAQKERQGPQNIWVVTPDQVPPPGPNDFIAAVADNIQRGGSIKTLIKTVSSGRM